MNNEKPDRVEEAETALEDADVEGHGLDDEDEQNLSVTVTGGVCA